MEFNPIPPVFTTSNRASVGGDRVKSSFEREGQNTFDNVRRNNASADDTNTGGRRTSENLDASTLSNRIGETRFSEKVIATRQFKEEGNRVFEEVNGEIELRQVVIDQKANPSAQAFLDVAEQDSDFRLIDIYV